MPLGFSGPPVSAALEDDFLRTLPPALVDAMRALVKQMQAEIIDPIVSASTPAECGQRFNQRFEKFFHYYLSLIQIMVAHVGLEPEIIARITQAGYRASETLVREVGPEAVGDDATMAALFGFSTMAKVSRALAAAPMPADEQQFLRLFTVIAAYSLATTCLLSPIHAAAKRYNVEVKPEIANDLALASEHFALEAHRMAKHMGLFPLRPMVGEVGEPDPEDLELANAGLDAWAGALTREEA
ncbi:MAG: hypothetical protein U0Q16_33800 [Bryobacteraceae bacterium]